MEGTLGARHCGSALLPAAVIDEHARRRIAGFGLNGSSRETSRAGPAADIDTSKEQPLAYSITRSARRKMDGGIVSPRALAVFMFMENSNLVGSSTGRSAGFTPLKILSTK